jgi:DNA repair protein RadC
MRPRERYMLQGPEQFGDEELLALALGTGCAGLPIRQVAAGLLSRAGGAAGLPALPPGAIQGVPGIGPARAVRLHASLALARRALLSVEGGAVITVASDAVPWFQPRLGGLDREELHALLLDRRQRVLAYRVISCGNDAHTIVDPRQIYREALLHRACAVIVAHNHPSGDPSPSRADVEVSLRLQQAGRVLGVELLDHVVLAGGCWVSLREQGLLPARCAPETPFAAERGPRDPRADTRGGPCSPTSSPSVPPTAASPSTPGG